MVLDLQYRRSATDLHIAHRQGHSVMPPPVVLVWSQSHARREGWGTFTGSNGPALVTPPCDAISRYCQPCTPLSNHRVLDSCSAIPSCPWLPRPCQ